MDTPLQYDDVEVLFAALAPFQNAAAALPGRDAAAGLHAGAPTLGACNQIGRFGVDEEIPGWGLFDVIQTQFTGTKVFGPMLGASQLVTVVEAAYTHVFDMPGQADRRSRTAAACASTGRAPRCRATAECWQAAMRTSTRSSRRIASRMPTPGATASRCASTT
jgi:hypothetical protein